jgi:hypothetical protein
VFQKVKHQKKWVCWSSNIYLGTFDNQIDAAKKYDTYALLKYGKGAQINGFITYEDIKDIDIETLRCYRPERDLPQYIYKHHKTGYEAKITYNKQNFRRSALTIEKCIEGLNEILDEINEIKIKEEKEHKSKEIIRNEKGQAIINAKGGIAIVSDNKWYDCMLHKWYKSEGYYKTTINKKKIKMHQFVMNAQEGDKVMFIDIKNKDDIRNENLKFGSSSEILHNSTKNRIIDKTSKYTGVSFNIQSNKWKAKICKDNKIYDLGLYDFESDAANAYAKKEQELYYPSLDMENKIIKLKDVKNIDDIEVTPIKKKIVHKKNQV